ncbi:uncharacterized protein PHACADRAFT_70827, partial [Phanerochaete carnosa HHB-10118-sp]
RFRMQDLPPELLAEVFYCYISLIEHARGHAERPPTPYAWLVIRHVCRAWRVVALVYPRLSCRIHVSTPECVQDMLDRSGTTPLFIDDVSDRKTVSRIEAQCRVFAHLDRIVWAQTSLYCTTPMPCTQRPIVSMLETIFIKPRMPGFSSPLFPGYTFPHLQNFTSHWMDLRSFYKLLPSGLRRLAIVRGLPDTDTSLDDFIALLSNLPQLEELRVRDLFYAPDPLAPEDVHMLLPFCQTATLKCLTSLHITDQLCENGSRLLHRLVHPASANVRLDFAHVSESVPCVLSPAILLTKFHASDCSPPQSLSISSSNDEAINVCLWTERLSSEELRAKQENGDDACFVFKTCGSPRRFVAEFVQGLPLSHVRSAYLFEPDSPSVLQWCELFSLLASVEELCIECGVWNDAEADPSRCTEASSLDDFHSLFPSLVVAKLHH